MKYFILGILLACTSPEPRPLPETRLEEIKQKDAIVLGNLDEEPLRQGTMKKEVEGIITTEIWSWTDEHGSPYTKTETLIYKNGKLVSQTLKDPEQGLTFSRQFRDGQVFQINEERKDGAESVYLEDGKIRGRMIMGKNPECLIYENGTPKFREMSACEVKFNTAP